MRGAVDEASSSSTTRIAGLRALITDLRPAALDELGAGPRSRRSPSACADAPGSRSTLDVDLAFERGERAARHAQELEATVYRVVQEALTNAAKHAGRDARQVDVVERDGAIEIARPRRRRGLRPRRRHAAGSACSACASASRSPAARSRSTSTPGEGTALHVVLPLVRRDDDAGDDL